MSKSTDVVILCWDSVQGRKANDVLYLTIMSELGMITSEYGKIQGVAAEDWQLCMKQVLGRDAYLIVLAAISSVALIPCCPYVARISYPAASCSYAAVLEADNFLSPAEVRIDQRAFRAFLYEPRYRRIPTVRNPGQYP